MNNKVTWLLPVKNGMPYLPETLASIEAQTYTDWEMLAWDNGSTDGTLELLQEWIPARLPGRIVSDRPMGLGASLAEMVKLAETELCARIDADDVNMPTRLERQVAFLQDHPKVAAVGSQMYRLDENGTNHGLFYPAPICNDDIVNALLHSNSMAHPSIVFRKSAILDVGNYRNVGPINIEDYDLWLRVAAKYQLANLDEALVKYRVHDGSTTVQAIKANRLTDAVDTRFVEHAPILFGCSENEARLLRERQHPRTISLLKQIALHLENGNSQAATKRLRSATMVTAGRSLVKPKDTISRVFLAFLGGGKRELLREIFAISKEAIKKTPVVSAVRKKKSSQT